MDKQILFLHKKNKTIHKQCINYRLEHPNTLQQLRLFKFFLIFLIGGSVFGMTTAWWLWSIIQYYCSDLNYELWLMYEYITELEGRKLNWMLNMITHSCFRPMTLANLDLKFISPRSLYWGSCSGEPVTARGVRPARQRQWLIKE